ncbi:hypothetical protein C0989_010962 [Termitomyces sp. Mn162]|nr:hypothetical protein C0989_010962 [Termitomyces sp. Mn162]
MFPESFPLPPSVDTGSMSMESAVPVELQDGLQQSNRDHAQSICMGDPMNIEDNKVVATQMPNFNTATQEQARTSPSVIHDENFPPLPHNTVSNKSTASKPRLGRVKLTLGHRQPSEGEKAKRPQPPSPARERTPKRHASSTLPPLQPSPLPINQSQIHNKSTPPPPNSQPRFTFNMDMMNVCSEHTPRDFDASTTAVGNSAWDNILVDTPPSSPSPSITLLGPKAYARAASTSPSFTNAQNYSQESGDGIYRDIKMENNITTNASGLKRTATLNGGWPKIHLGSHPLNNVATAQAKTWNNVTSAKLWARLFRDKYEPNSLATVDRTRALIKSLVCAESDMVLGVSFPLQERSMESDRFPNPYHILISGLSSQQAKHLVNLEVVSTKDITVVFKAFQEQRPSFVLTIYGLTFVNFKEANSVVTDLVVKCIQESEQVMKHIILSAPERTELVASDIFSSISVKFLEVKRSNANGGNFRGWNVFLNHSYLSDEDHIKLIQFMRTCTFPSATAGFGLPLVESDTLLCINCKSINHDTPNFPFPDLSGWLGYKPNSNALSQAPNTAYNKDAGKS